MKGAKYQISEVYGGRSTPLAVEVTFGLPYHGWCQLEKSVEWHLFLEALEALQKE